MKLIAHRGNHNGQNPLFENTASYLEEALAKGYDVEFDVFCIPGLSLDSSPPNPIICLGHDGKIIESLTMGSKSPLNKIPSIEWLRDSRKWVHCKDQESYDILSKYDDIQCFMQEESEWESCVGVTEYRWINSGAAKRNVTFDSKMAVHESWVKPTATSGFMPCAVYGDFVSKYKDLGLQDKPWHIDTILLDVDGVMTNGRKTIIQGNGEEYLLSKEFCDKDWTAIKRMQSAGLRVVMISADKWNKEVADNRKVEFFQSTTTGRDSKLNVVRRYGVDLTKSIYIGDDYYDLELLWHVAKAYCPEDAIEEVKRCSKIIHAKGGENCVAAFYDTIKGNIQENFPHEK